MLGGLFEAASLELAAYPAIKGSRLPARSEEIHNLAGDMFRILLNGFSARIAAMSRASCFVLSGDDRVAVLDYHYYRYNDISCKWFFSDLVSLVLCQSSIVRAQGCYVPRLGAPYKGLKNS